MKKYILLLIAAVVVFSSCDDEDSVEVKDYGLKTFSAEMNYDPEAAHGEVSYKQQVFYALGDEEAIAIGTYGEDSWTDFNLVEDEISINVTGWDIVFTNYTVNLGTEDEPYAYKVTGVLIADGVEVALVEDTESDDVSESFSNLSLSDVSGLEYSADMDVIGYSWKAYDSSTQLFKVNDNWFYILKIGEETYKLRFVNFYGESTSERIIKIEYQLMQ